MKLVLDDNGILLNQSKMQNVETAAINNFLKEYDIVSPDEQISIRNKIMNKEYHFHIKYFAEGGECFPMEVKP